MYRGLSHCLCVLSGSILLASQIATPEVLAAGIYRNWQHSGGDDSQFEDWLFQGSAFQQTTSEGGAHYIGTYETPWSDPLIDLRIAIAIQTPPPINLPPPVGGPHFQIWQPYIGRWPESISLEIYNYEVGSYDVSVTTPYTGGTLSNNADYAMVANLVHPYDAAHRDEGYIRVRYQLVLRDDFPDLAYTRLATIAFSSGNQTTGTPVPEPSTLALGALGLLGRGCRRRK